MFTRPDRDGMGQQPSTSRMGSHRRIIRLLGQAHRTIETTHGWDKSGGEKPTWITPKKWRFGTKDKTFEVVWGVECNLHL